MPGVLGTGPLSTRRLPRSEPRIRPASSFPGGPRSVNDPGAPTVDPGIFALGVPVLGICYGLQLIAKLKGGRVARVGPSGVRGQDALHKRARALFSPGFPRSCPAG